MMPATAGAMQKVLTQIAGRAVTAKTVLALMRELGLARIADGQSAPRPLRTNLKA